MRIWDDLVRIRLFLCGYGTSTYRDREASLAPSGTPVTLVISMSKFMVRLPYIPVRIWVYPVQIPSISVRIRVTPFARMFLSIYRCSGRSGPRLFTSCGYRRFL